MRRILFFLLPTAGLLTVISGIGEEASAHHGRPWQHGGPRHHIIAAGFFILLWLVHLWTNRRSILGYLKVGKTAKKRD